MILQVRMRSDAGLQFFDFDGKPMTSLEGQEVVVIHTLGHSPGSICLLRLPKPKEDGYRQGILFTGDTYAWTSRDGG